MTRKLFVNLPVADLPKAKRFYEALGFACEPRFSGETGACIVISDTHFVMLVTHGQWRKFTKRPIPDAGSSEVSLALTCDSKAEVDQMVEAAAAAGGSADVNPVEDHGFMYQRSLCDPDGHVWEPMWMDPAVAAGEAPVPETAK